MYCEKCGAPSSIKIIKLEQKAKIKEEELNSKENQIKAQAILIAFFLMNIIVIFYFLSINPLPPYSLYIIIPFIISYSILGFGILDIIFLSISLKIFLKDRSLGYRRFKVISIAPAIVYNYTMVWFFIINLNLFILELYLFLDAILLSLNYEIIKNKQVLCHYLRPKYNKCHKCGSKIKIHENYCPKCLSLLVDKEYGLEEVQVQKAVHKFLSDKKIAKPVEIVEKSSELEESVEDKPKTEENMGEVDSELLEDLSILIGKIEKKLLKKYLLQRFIVVSKQIRNELDKLNFSREEKIELLRDLAFLASSEQQSFLELLLNLCNN
ncbi:MAG: zinc ribbon domain-containing protein [Promethearchaeota archaeon]